MAYSAQQEARIALLRVLGSLSVSRGGVYPSKGVITVPSDIEDGIDYRATIWNYPDGGSEIRITSLPAPKEGADRHVIPETHTVYLSAAARFDRDHEMCAALGAVCDRITGEVTGYLYDDRLCPVTGAVAEVFAQEINAKRNARRAASKARRLARSNGFVYMATLTVPGYIGKDRVSVVKLWRAFCKRVGVRFFHRVHGGWLAFPEEHPDTPGTYHLHVLHRNRINAVRLRVAWTAFLLRAGYVLPIKDGRQTRYVRTHCKYWGSAHKAARYAAKYLSKGFGASCARVLGTHRYLSSQGLVDCSIRIERDDLRLVVAANGSVADWLPHGGIKRDSEATEYVWWTWAALEPLCKGVM